MAEILCEWVGTSVSDLTWLERIALMLGSNYSVEIVTVGKRE